MGGGFQVITNALKRLYRDRNMPEIITTCAIDCPDNCGMIAHVENGRIVRLKGNPQHGYTRGFLCKKGYDYPQRVYSADRVLFPQLRTSTGWKRITWDEALGMVAEKIRFFQEAYGNGSIMHYWRTSSWGATKNLVGRLFNLLGGVTTQCGSLCSGSARAAITADRGIYLGNAPEDLLNSKTILIWGRDPYKTGIHLVPLLQEARHHGARLIVIDPIRTRTAESADEHLALRPGSDGYLAIGIGKSLLGQGLVDRIFLANHTEGFERHFLLLDSISMREICRECDIKETVIEKLALTYGQRRPSSILLGWGLNKWAHSPDMIRLIDALGALTGSIGLKGGGVNIGIQTGRHFDPEAFTVPQAKYSRTIPEPLLGQRILEASNPPIKMIWINGTNPVVSCPNSMKVIRALKTIDFVVVVDHFMTDTADLAHLFLPATTFLEEEDIVVSWGHNWIGPANKAIEPSGEAKSDLQISQELGERLGLGAEMAGTPREWLKRIFKPMESLGLPVERVMEGPVRCPIAPSVAFEDRMFTTSSGKFEFIQQLCVRPDPKYPFHLLSVLGQQWLNSLLLKEEHPEIPYAILHPAVALKMGLGDRSKARLKSSAGVLTVEVRLSDMTRPDTILMFHGTWIKRGGTANQLTEDLISTSGDMAGYHSTTVGIESIS